MTVFCRELRALIELSWPAMVTQVGLMMISVVDTLVVARVSTDALAAAALAHMWQWSTMSLGMGAVMGADPMISQAHGRGDGQGAALGVQRALLVGWLASVPIGAALALTGPVLRLLGQTPEIAELAERYNLAGWSPSRSRCCSGCGARHAGRSRSWWFDARTVARCAIVATCARVPDVVHPSSGRDVDFGWYAAWIGLRARTRSRDQRGVRGRRCGRGANAR